MSLWLPLVLLASTATSAAPSECTITQIRPSIMGDGDSKELSRTIPVRIGEHLRVEVSCPPDEAKNIDCDNLQLLVSGFKVGRTDGCYYDLEGSNKLYTLKFELMESNQEVLRRQWTDLLEGLKLTESQILPLQVLNNNEKLALEEDKPFQIKMRLLSSMEVLGLILAIAALLFTSGYLVRKRGLLSVPEEGKSYSLAYLQMLLWFILVMSGYLFVWLVRNELPSIPTNLLTLMGIGTATAVGKRMIPGSNTTANENMHAKSMMEQLLSQAQNLSVHRFQMLASTAVIAVIYVVLLVQQRSFPDLDSTLLVLMGISNGTYLGFKFKEPTPPAQHAS